MEIFFCDLCNESVPQSDLAKRKAYIRKGRIVCASCDASMSMEGEPAQAVAPGAPVPSGAHVAAPMPAGAPVAATTSAPLQGAEPLLQPQAPAYGSPPSPFPPPYAPAYSRRRAGNDGLAWLALLVSLGVAVWAWDKIKVSSLEGNAKIADLRGELRSASGSLDDRLEDLVAEGLGRGNRVQDQLGDQRAALQGGLSDVRLEAGEIRSRLDELSEQVNRTAGLAASIEKNSVASGELEVALGGLVTGLQFLTARVDEFEALSLAAPLPTPAELRASSQPAWIGLVSDLESENSGTRWTAVTALGETGDAAVVEYIAPLLGDSDIFVRMATARVLGDLGAPQGVPSLIDALEDSEAPVREAAVVALRQITGRNFRYDPLADESDRARKVRAWQEWWRKARDDFLGENTNNG